MEKGLGTTCFENGKLQVVKDRQASRKLCFLDLLVNVASSLTKKFQKSMDLSLCIFSFVCKRCQWFNTNKALQLLRTFCGSVFL